MTELHWREALSSAEHADVVRLLGAAKAADQPDGIPVDTAGFLGVVNSRHLIARENDDLVGYAHVDPNGDTQGNHIVELTVHPDVRQRGIGATLTSALLDELQNARVRAWSHGDHPAAAVLAEKFGFRRAREVRRLRWSGPNLPEVQLPVGTRLRTFQPGRDESEIVAVNRSAFDWHPEQGALSVADLWRAQTQPWFDPAGFFVAVDAHDRILGFHWTKVHQAVPQPIGEVYVVGIAPDSQGKGLGKALTLAGLRYLRNVGLQMIMLYVESDNTPALRLYTSLGFTAWDADVQYAN